RDSIFFSPDALDSPQPTTIQQCTEIEGFAFRARLRGARTDQSLVTSTIYIGGSTSRFAISANPELMPSRPNAAVTSPEPARDLVVLAGAEQLFLFGYPGSGHPGRCRLDPQAYTAAHHSQVRPVEALHQFLVGNDAQQRVFSG